MTHKKTNSANFAAIDIGSNAVRLLIKHISADPATPSASKEQLIRVPLRLGLDVFTGGKISKRKSRQLVLLLRAFADLLKIYDVRYYKACATSALRDAGNGKSVLALIRKETGIKIHVLSGKEEARLIYSTHAEFMPVSEGSYLFVDVGGGSTEINLMVGSALVVSRSYNIGTLRVLSRTVDPDEWRRLAHDLGAMREQYGDIELLGTGGNINKLYRLVDSRDRQLQRMTVEALEEIHQRMAHLTLEERVRNFKLKYDRAEVIVPASHVFLTVARLVGACHIYVPTVGLSDGIIDSLVSKKMSRLRKCDDKEVAQEPQTAGEAGENAVTMDQEEDFMDMPFRTGDVPGEGQPLPGRPSPQD